MPAASRAARKAAAAAGCIHTGAAARDPSSTKRRVVWSATTAVNSKTAAAARKVKRRTTAALGFLWSSRITGGESGASRFRSGRGLERPGDRLGFLVADRHLLRLRAELLVPRLDRVGPGGKVLDR